MFHFHDNLFFGRRADGSVRIVKFSRPPAHWPNADAINIGVTVLDVTIDPSGWASVVSSVSAKGEELGRFYEAECFHAGKPIVNGVTLTQQVVLACNKCNNYVVPSSCHLNVADIKGVSVVTGAYCEKCWDEIGKQAVADYGAIN
jgi:hypothetical protein